jgi:hypothetical protein
MNRKQLDEYYLVAPKKRFSPQALLEQRSYYLTELTKTINELRNLTTICIFDNTRTLSQLASEINNINTKLGFIAQDMCYLQEQLENKYLQS